MGEYGFVKRRRVPDAGRRFYRKRVLMVEFPLETRIYRKRPVAAVPLLVPDKYYPPVGEGRVGEPSTHRHC